jgi:nicotinamide-nucleotide amidase
MIDERIGDLEGLSNPSVGLAAHSGQVDVRVTAKGDTETQVNQMIAGVEQELVKRLGGWIYGADDQTLEKIALQNLAQKGWRLAVVESGLGGELTGKLSAVGEPFTGGQVLAALESPSELPGLTRAYREMSGAEAALGVAVVPGSEKTDVYFIIMDPSGNFFPILSIFQLKF